MTVMQILIYKEDVDLYSYEKYDNVGKGFYKIKANDFFGWTKYQKITRHKNPNDEIEISYSYYEDSINMKKTNSTYEFVETMFFRVLEKSTLEKLKVLEVKYDRKFRNKSPHILFKSSFNVKNESLFKEAASILKDDKAGFENVVLEYHVENYKRSISNLKKEVLSPLEREKKALENDRSAKHSVFRLYSDYTTNCCFNKVDSPYIVLDNELNLYVINNKNLFDIKGNEIGKFNGIRDYIIRDKNDEKEIGMYKDGLYISTKY